MSSSEGRVFCPATITGKSTAFLFFAPVEPVHALRIQIWKRTECPGQQEITFHLPDQIPNLSFGPGATGFAEPGYESIVTKKNPHEVKDIAPEK
ncbi:MAG TPA: hypothetical protein HA272_00230 [Methanoregula sp.]|nr:hypothetical protein [Methanoregula sp.]